MKPIIETDERGVEFISNTISMAEPPQGWAICGTCGIAWNDEKSTAVTPTPAGRCPFEYDHGRIAPATESARLLLAKHAELRQAQADVIALTRQHLRNLVNEEVPGTRYIGVNVTRLQGDDGDFTSASVEGFYDANGRIADFVTDDWGDDGLIQELVEADEIHPDDYRVQAYDVVEGTWRSDVTTLRETVSAKEALDYAIFAINTWEHPDASDAKDVTALEQNATAIKDKLAELRDSLG